MANSWPTDSMLSANEWPTNGPQLGKQFLQFIRSIVSRLLVNCWLLVGDLLASCWYKVAVKDSVNIRYLLEQDPVASSRFIRKHYQIELFAMLLILLAWVAGGIPSRTQDAEVPILFTLHVNNPASYAGYDTF